MPEELTMLRSDIDFGLLSLEEFEGIEEILDYDNDPFSEIEESILKEFGRNYSPVYKSRRKS